MQTGLNHLLSQLTRRLFLAGFCCLLCSLFLSAPTFAADTVNSAIVKIYTVASKPNYYWPWQQRTAQNTGSGFVISEGRILTSAHVIANQTFVEVRKNGAPQRYQATVKAISHEADLALLTVEDRSFYADITPLPLGKLPNGQQEVLVYGFPTGGDTLSTTKGIISRIEHITYSHSGIMFLAGQIDAAINPGNSGGPVISDGQVVGVAMQGRRDADNIGYFVPVPIIEHVLDDIADGHYDGFPDLGVIAQNLENPDLKKMHQLPSQKTGILIRHVLPDSHAAGQLQVDDILLAIDDHPIADDATVEFRPMERTLWGHYIDMHQLGDTLRLKVFRNGAPLDIEIKLDETSHQLMSNSLIQHDTPPRFFIFGGIVFSPLTINLLHEWGHNWRKNAPNDLVTTIDNLLISDNAEPVVILQVLASNLNKGYHNLHSLQIKSVNGETYRDFKDFYRKVATAEGPYLVFTDIYNNQYAIDKAKALSNHKQILQTYRIPYDHSSDLQPSLLSPNPVAKQGKSTEGQPL